MIPLGRRPLKFPGKTDYRPIGKGVVNWWENCAGNDENKSLDKRLAKKYINESLRQLEEDKGDNEWSQFILL